MSHSGFARRSITYAAAAVVDPDGVKTTFATVADPVALDSTDWNGAILGSGETVLDLPRTITITLSNDADQFSTDDIVITGTRNGAVVTETLNAANDDGNVTLRGVQPFDTLTGIDLPAMGGTGGSITIGVQDICAPYGDVFHGVEAHATGTLNLGYGGTDLESANTDALTIEASQIGFVKPVKPNRILTSAALAVPTTVSLTVYLG